MNHLPFKQVDVFSALPFCGNPVAVVFDAQALSAAQMQQMARWTNLSETAFILPATHGEADYRVRIFTPMAELPFAGHPSLGSAHAVLEAGLAGPREGVLVQECAVGLVRLRHTGPGRRLALELPPSTLAPIDATLRSRVESAVGVPFICEPWIVDLGPRWLTCEVPSIRQLLAIRPDFASLACVSLDLAITGVNLFARDAGATEVRSFAPACGVNEDPVCGSGQGAVAAVLRARGETQPYTARQGRTIGRDGYAFLEFVPDGPIRLGGDAITCVDGHIICPIHS